MVHYKDCGGASPLSLALANLYKYYWDIPAISCWNFYALSGSGF